MDYRRTQPSSCILHTVSDTQPVFFSSSEYSGRDVKLSIYVRDVQIFYGKGLHATLRAGSGVAGAKITNRGVQNGLNYCVVVRVYTDCT